MTCKKMALSKVFTVNTLLVIINALKKLASTEEATANVQLLVECF